MDEKYKNSDKARRDFDLTSPDIRIPDRNNPNLPAQGGSDSDRTTINNPLPRAENQMNRPAPPQNQYDLTTVKIGPYVEDDERVRPSPPVAPTPQPAAMPSPAQTPPARSAQRRIPLWVWLTIGGVALIITVGLLALFLIPSTQAFTLKVLNAPAGSTVYIDDIPSGVQQKDGTIIVQSLRAGESRDIRVVHEGYEEWRTTVKGVGGEVQEITAKLRPLVAKPTTANEIDYLGKMVLIPAGAFTMGSNNFNADEKPEHQVDLPAYYIDKYEVTNEQYGKFCDATIHPPPVNPFWDPQYFQNNPQMPVIGISYSDAAAYALWAGKRLPTESEWEKAASWGPNATRKRQWPWGDAPEQGRANLGTDHPANVGQYSTGASAYGVHDMTGNVREWVDAFYQPYPGNTTSNSKFGQNLRVARGGDFRAKLDFARTTSRLAVPPEFKTNTEDAKAGRSSLIGFRCAVAADDPKLKAHLQQPGQ